MKEGGWTSWIPQRENRPQTCTNIQEKEGMTLKAEP